MKDLFASLVDRALGKAPVLPIRLPGLFEASHSQAELDLMEIDEYQQTEPIRPAALPPPTEEPPASKVRPGNEVSEPKPAERLPEAVPLGFQLHGEVPTFQESFEPRADPPEVRETQSVIRPIALDLPSMLASALIPTGSTKTLHEPAIRDFEERIEPDAGRPPRPPADRVPAEIHVPAYQPVDRNDEVVDAVAGVEVRIGRIEVKAPSPPSPRAQPVQRPTVSSGPAIPVSLRDYLAARGRR